MLKPRRLNIRRRAHNHKEYLMGSVEFIEDVYDKLIKDAQSQNNAEVVKVLSACKKEALKKASKSCKNSANQIEQMQ